MREYWKETLIELCCAYTIISVAGAVTNLILGTETNNANVIIMFVFCTIAVFVLSLHKLLSRFSPLVMILIQFAVSLGLMSLVVYLLSFIEPVSPRGWFEFIRSFVIVYALGAGFYYYRVFKDAKSQDKLIKEIQEKNREQEQQD